MQESYCEELAPHTGLESCVAVREGWGEALAEVRMGRVLSRETSLQGANVVAETEGNILHTVMARYAGTLRGLRPRARTETPFTGTGRSCNRLWIWVP
jgi:hypothetical protein